MSALHPMGMWRLLLLIVAGAMMVPL
jgi:hypothetical protein